MCAEISIAMSLLYQSWNTLNVTTWAPRIIGSGLVVWQWSYRRAMSMLFRVELKRIGGAGLGKDSDRARGRNLQFNAPFNVCL